MPVVGLLLWQRAREEFTRPRLWWAGLLFLALVAVHVGHMVAVRNEGWGTTQERMSLAYVASNLRVNGWFYLADARFPMTYTLLAILGLSGRRARGRPGGDDGVLLPVVLRDRAAVLCGQLQLRRRCSLLARDLSAAGDPGRIGDGSTRPPGSTRVEPGLPALPGLTAAVAFQFLWYLPVVRATDDGAWAARADVQIRAGRSCPTFEDTPTC